MNVEKGHADVCSVIERVNHVLTRFHQCVYYEVSRFFRFEMHIALNFLLESNSAHDDCIRIRPISVSSSPTGWPTSSVSSKDRINERSCCENRKQSIYNPFILKTIPNKTVNVETVSNCFVCFLRMMLESPPSTPGMCGYLLKFPSEGSNHPVHSTAVGDGSYPAKCPTCQVAWASSASDMRKHRSECTDTTKEQDGLTEADPWGVPRQFWIEIDFERELLQVNT